MVWGDLNDLSDIQDDLPDMLNVEVPHEVIRSESYALLEQDGGRLSYRQIQEELKSLDPYSLLLPFLKVTKEKVGLSLKPGGGALVEVMLGEQEVALREKAKEGLKGLRFVIDPGHFGGAWSKVERRHFVIDEGEGVREGTITWATALSLKKFLEEQGAEVMLSRGPPPEDMFFDAPVELSEAALLDWVKAIGRDGMSEWLKENSHQTKMFVSDLLRVREEDELAAFKIYNRFDFRRRADLCDSFDPDLILSLHYNTAEDPRTNKILVFMPGNALPSELKHASERYFVFRRALQGDQSMLEKIAVTISYSMQEKLSLPAAEKDASLDSDGYHVKLAVNSEAGVYARHLAMLKRPRAPALLLEGPCMNNAKENARLLREDVEMDGAFYPQRSEDYAKAVVEALEKESWRLWARREMR